ncbi:MAG: prephenate dehydrogenase [Chitinispirillaceae bacterium]|nr:prephenate dehydrogenase [Chitinispirillaceae bacterium]
MSFNPRTITIYSVGLIGGSIGLALKTSGFKGSIIGLSSSENLETALKLGCIDEGFPYSKLGEAVSRADLLILCSPISAIIKTIEELAPLPLPAGLVVTDVGSTKKSICAAAAEKLPGRAYFIGGHPMAGSEKSGPAASDPYLFQNAIHVLTPAGGTPSGKDLSIAGFFERRLGCRTLFLDPERHDRMAAAVSHLPHLLAIALVNEVQEAEKAMPGTLALAAGGFRDMTRVAGSPYSLWRDILMTNKNALSPLIDRMTDRLADIKQRLLNDSLSALFEQSHETRSHIPLDSKGFIRQLSEVLVVAPDQPGVIASIAASLAAEKININDIEVLKVREGEGGTIRLAFTSAAAAGRAVMTLEKAGFQARERT